MRIGRFLNVAFGVTVLSLSAVAQEGISTQTTIFKYSFSKIGTAAWGAGGAAVAKAGDTAAFHNPACLSGNGTRLYLELGRRGKAEYPLDIDFDNQFVLPASIIISRAVGSAHVAVGYFNQYNNHLEGILSLSLDGVIFEDFEFESNLNVHTFFAAANYPMTSKLSFGFSFGLNYLKDNNRLDSFNEHGTGTGFNLGAGLYFRPLQTLRFGAALKYFSDINYHLNSDSEVLLSSSQLDNNDQLQVPSVGLKMTASFPKSVQVGGSFDASSWLTFSVMVDFQDWSADEDSDHKFDFHGGVEYRYSPVFGLSAGYFTLGGGAFDQKFLTAGIRWTPGSTVSLSATILDAQLLSSEQFAQRYFMLGIGYRIW